MLKRNIKIALFAFSILFSPLLASAAALITEVQYDLEGTDTGREWIEVKNTGTADIDLSAWKLFEANTSHRLSAVGSGVLSPGSFAVIADNTDKFKSDNLSYGGLLFDSTFSLSNEGETLVLRDENGNDADSVSYLPAWGAAGDGTSLQRTASETWIAAVPTPGAATREPSGQAPETAAGTSTQEGVLASKADSSAAPISSSHSTHSSQAVANTSFDEPVLEVTSGRARLGFVGVPLEFEAKVKSAQNIQAGNQVANRWSMGDGSEASGQFVSHAYEYPGDYVVILNSSVSGAEAVSKVNVKIIEPHLSISQANDSYVEISNLDLHELNIGKWRIETAGRRFIVPQDTIVPARSSIKIPSSASHLSSLREYVRIMNPSGVELSRTAASEPVSVAQWGGDTLVSLEGLSEAALRERIVAALERTQARGASHAQLASPNPAPKSQIAANAEGGSASSTSLSAAVIYTVEGGKGKNWWDSLKALVGR